MLISVQQKYILSALRRLGCVRKRQLLVMLRAKYRSADMEITEHRLDAMLRQLRYGVSDIRLESDFVILAGKQPNVRLLEAVDVMLELTEGAPQEYTLCDSPPALLRFVWGDSHIRLFSVAALSDPMVRDLSGVERRPLEHIVWISDREGVPAGISLPPKHFYAARQPDGSHRFYGSDEP